MENLDVKRWVLILVGLLFSVTAIPVFAQDVTGAGIETMAQAVPYIEAIDADGYALASGSGTLVTPTGRIYTNYHVIEGASDFAIYLLQNISELPVLSYYASAEYISPSLDFAVLQIDRDANGNPINANNLSLPYLPAVENTATIGETVRIFGYPGIGDGYMVTTTGDIVTIQNGDVGDARLPVWYWTDGEISAGNSGGLTVDAEGHYLGIPTWVVSEEETSGKLGGVMPINAALHSLETESSLNPADPNSVQSMDGGASGSLYVYNDSSVSVCYLYISPSSASNWGDDQLGSGNILPSGEYFNLSVSLGSYDLLLRDCDQNNLDEIYNIEVTAETVLHFTGDETYIDPSGLSPDGQSTALIDLTIKNKSTENICFVYISLPENQSWGDDQLGAANVIAPNNTFTWQKPAGIYDILLEDCTGNTLLDQRNLDASTDATLVFE